MSGRTGLHERHAKMKEFHIAYQEGLRSMAAEKHPTEPRAEKRKSEEEARLS